MGSESYLYLEGVRYYPENSIKYKEYLLGENPTKYKENTFRYKSRKDAENSDLKSKITTTFGKNKKSVLVWGKGSQYDTGERDIVSNMGYHGTTAQTFTLQLEGRGEYRFSDLKVIVQPMDSYGENYVKLAGVQVNGYTDKWQLCAGDCCNRNRSDALHCNPVSEGMESMGKWKRDKNC